MGTGGDGERLILQIGRAPGSRYALWAGLGLVGIAALTCLVFYLLRPPPARLSLSPSRYNQLLGWSDDPVAAAVPAFLRSCVAFQRAADDAPLAPRAKDVDFGSVGEWRAPCAAAANLPAGDDMAARHFFETDFVPLLAGNNGTSEGLFTGYYEVTLNGSRKRGGPFQIPIYRRPADPKRFSRAEIEDGALTTGQGLELAWVDDPVDAFFLEIQGSGQVRLKEGGTIRIGYDGSNGHAYVPVGRLLFERGEIPREQLTMQTIRAWMKSHAQEGAALRRENPSYVFFREIMGEGPLGAQRVPLSAGRSLAVDRSFIPLGIPIWLDAQERFNAGVIRRLVVAQDTGGAIKGPVRGDLFWGHGKEAAEGAGAMNARGRYYLLLPRSVAARFGPVVAAD